MLSRIMWDTLTDLGIDGYTPIHILDGRSIIL